MALTYGFYDAIDGDRTYKADDFNNILGSLVTDGKLKNEDGAVPFDLSLSDGSGTVTISPGTAFLAGHWVKLDTDYTVDVSNDLPSSGYKSLYQIYLNVRNASSARRVDISVSKIKTVTTATTPTYDWTVYREGSSGLNQWILGAFVLYGDDRKKFFVTNFGPTSTYYGRTEVLGYAKLKTDGSDDTTVNDTTNHKIMRATPNNLGTTISSSQIAAIRNGSFDGLYVGDYWESDGIKYYIADFDYYRYRGSTDSSYANGKHHAVIIPSTDNGIATNWSSYDSIYGRGVTGSLAQVGLDNGKYLNWSSGKAYAIPVYNRLVSDVKKDATHDDMNGNTATLEYTTKKYHLPTCAQIFGREYCDDGRISGFDNFQLALFAQSPMHARSTHSYWLRDIYSATSICVCNPAGYVYRAVPNTTAFTIYVKPIFCIG